MKQDIIEFLRNQSQSNREIIDEISGIIFQSLPNIKEKVVNDIEINVLIDETLYIKNPNQINITFQEIRINDIDCLGLNGTYSDVIKIFNVSSCIGNISDEILDILVITDKKNLSKKDLSKKDLEQLIFSSACSNFTYKNNVCLDNVVAYWPFNNTILDFSGNGLDVTLNSGATVSNAGLRTLGGSYATIPTVNISLENGLSYSLWLNTTSFGSSWARIVELGRGASGSDRDYAIMFKRSSSTDLLRGQIDYDGLALTASKIELNIIQHLVMTVNQSGYMKLYINGSLKSQGDGSSLLPGVRNYNRIGTTPFSEYYNGYFKHLIIMNRTLTDDEVLEIFNEGYD